MISVRSGLVAGLGTLIAVVIIMGGPRAVWRAHCRTVSRMERGRHDS